jgi:hypothetical protein
LHRLLFNMNLFHAHSFFVYCSFYSAVPSYTIRKST